MKPFIFISFLFLASCSILPELGFVEKEIEQEIASEIKIGAEAIQKHNEAK